MDKKVFVEDQRLKDITKELCGYINATLELQSLLYDLDMLPEQLTRGTHEWMRMLTLAAAWRGHEERCKEKWKKGKSAT